ncbi:hypothetical protein D3C78_823150 [compost metagenome]
MLTGCAVFISAFHYNIDRFFRIVNSILPSFEGGSQKFGGCLLVVFEPFGVSEQIILQHRHTFFIHIDHVQIGFLEPLLKQDRVFVMGQC